MARREYLKARRASAGTRLLPAVKINGGTTIYLAGQTGYQDERGETYPNNFDGQARVAFERMRRDPRNCRRQTRRHRDHDGLYHRHGQRHALHPTQKGVFQRRRAIQPARSSASKNWPGPEMMIEIQAIAVVD